MSTGPLYLRNMFRLTYISKETRINRVKIYALVSSKKKSMDYGTSVMLRKKRDRLYSNLCSTKTAYIFTYQTDCYGSKLCIRTQLVYCSPCQMPFSSTSLSANVIGKRFKGDGQQVNTTSFREHT
jgi:hypothetical protein